MKKLRKNGKSVNIMDSPANRALIPGMAKRARPLVLSRSLRPVK
jgi:hypothetical protein